MGNEPPYLGGSVALSADGNTAIAGGSGDNNGDGAAWVFTRVGGAWTQQAKLAGTGSTGRAAQGIAVAISADGNTALVGGHADDPFKGAAWVFIRTGTVWSQQGTKLVGSGADSQSLQGFSVALSRDGNTAIVGGYGDDSNTGAAWIFTRSEGVWRQQGDKLVGTGAAYNPCHGSYQGYAVALSGDGNTALVGGPADNDGSPAGINGAAWVYARNAGVWSQQGSKLVGTGAMGASQGYSMALSGDGLTALVGGNSDNSGVGAAWVFSMQSNVPPKALAIEY